MQADDFDPPFGVPCRPVRRRGADAHRESTMAENAYLEMMLGMRTQVTVWLLDPANQVQLQQAGEVARGGQEARAHCDRALVMAGGRRMWMECVHLHIMAIILGIDIALIDTSGAGDDVAVYCGGDGATLADMQPQPWTTAVRRRDDL